MSQQSKPPDNSEKMKIVQQCTDALKMLEMQVEAVGGPYKLGAPMRIRIKLTNHGDTIALRHWGDPWLQFEISVKDRFSRPVPYTKEMDWKTRRGQISHRSDGVKPKETYELELPLNEMFAIDSPGIYKVDVWQIIKLGEIITTAAPTLTISVVE
jgi:hypothetical protein